MPMSVDGSSFMPARPRKQCYIATSPDRKRRTHLKAHLAAFKGILQADGVRGLRRLICIERNGSSLHGRMSGGSSPTFTPRQKSPLSLLEAIQRIAAAAVEDAIAWQIR